MNKSKFLKSDLEKTYYKNKMYKTNYRYNKFTKNKSIFSSITRLFSSSLGGLPLLLVVVFFWLRYNDIINFFSKILNKPPSHSLNYSNISLTDYDVHHLTETFIDATIDYYGTNQYDILKFLTEIRTKDEYYLLDSKIINHHKNLDKKTIIKIIKEELNTPNDFGDVFTMYSDFQNVKEHYDRLEIPFK